MSGEREIMRLKYAFAMHMVQVVIEADEIILPEEEAYFEECFPQELIESLNLVDEQVRKSLYEQAVDVLPQCLSLEEKLDLFGMFLGASVSDGEMEFREFGVLETAAAILAIPHEEVVAYFDRMFDER